MFARLKIKTMGLLVPNHSVYEETLHEMKVGDLSMKLTNEKLFINTLGSSETFALRSISGIGVIDLVEKYNAELSIFKEKAKKPWVIIVLCGIIGLFSFFNLISSGFDINRSGTLSAFIIFSGLSAYFYLRNDNLTPPSLRSAVRIMISGTTRDFEFDKNAPNASDIGKFVALIEDTLTSYHRN